MIFHEGEAQAVLCKPKLLPLKSFTFEKLEKMQKEATAKAQETILEKQREIESQFYPGSNSGIHRINCAYSKYNCFDKCYHCDIINTIISHFVFQISTKAQP